MPRTRRDAKPSTTRFIALLRALGLAVSSFGVSHAQLERRLCDRISAGHRALRAMQDDPAQNEREELRRLITRKSAAEESGLARSDGRRDRAGGQRIGELLAGKYPRDAMPSRRRVEVCVDVLLEVVEEKDPDGYADGRYGTRQMWQELWLEADQGRVPAIGAGMARTVAGYLDVAIEQLARTAGVNGPPGTAPAEPPALREATDAPATRPPEALGSRPDPATPARGDTTEPSMASAPATGTRHETVHRQDTPRLPSQAAPLDSPQGAPSDSTQGAVPDSTQSVLPASTQGAVPDSTQSVLPASTQRSSRRPRKTALIWRPARMRSPVRMRTWLVLAACLACFIAGGFVGRIPTSAAQPAQLISTQPYPIVAGQPITIPIRPSSRQDWYLDLRLNLGHTKEQGLQFCSYRGTLTYHVEVDGKSFPTARSPRGRRDVAVNGVHVGPVTSMNIVVTFDTEKPYRTPTARQVAEPPRCELTLDLTGSVLRTADHPETPIPSHEVQGNGPLAGKKRLKIAVKIDQPGIGEIVDYDRRGIDIDVANYIAQKLGAMPEWHDVTSQNRETLIESGQVDLVIASYSMNEDRLDKITFAGPYLIAGQDILIHKSDADAITGRESLKDRKVCGVFNSASTERLIRRFGTSWNSPRHLIWRNGYGECVNELLARKVDAISTDNSLLAGYVAKYPDRLQLVGRPFSTEEYGIGLPKNATRDASRINAILQQMINDGSWAESIRHHLGREAEPFVETPPNLYP
ncbi:transporter substrate-binding domain-containing protein [Actinomadura sp. HBU206391]|uniref:transporter substrate-binding domain-containing protein n=1 Tax=Actinomadura sp. HBU206391 TaxID=2731692 RepID=UPI00164FB928|nr:transporter substrate-binding domain-containing protein [Actinomadura sp. HBU206391]MBC6456807.1 transporter substrate-binding domain-containing protein [Actinomadura sp. HBU206391]